MRFCILIFAILLFAGVASCAHVTPDSECRTRVNDCLAKCRVQPSVFEREGAFQSMPMDSRSPCERQCQDQCLWK